MADPEVDLQSIIKTNNAICITKSSEGERLMQKGKNKLQAIMQSTLEIWQTIFNSQPLGMTDVTN